MALCGAAAVPTASSTRSWPHPALVLLRIYTTESRVTMKSRGGPKRSPAGEDTDACVMAG